MYASACGMWYSIFQFSVADLNQAKLAELWLEVSLSTGIVEQNVKYVLWSGTGSQCASLVKCEAKYDFKTWSNAECLHI